MEGVGFWIWLILGSILSIIWLILFGINIKHRYFNESLDLDASMRAMLLGNVIVLLLMFGICFILFDHSAGWPFAAFCIWIGLYLIAELVSAIYLISPDSGFTNVITWFHEKIGTNPLKGWGGETFAEFTNGIGVMVAVGINLVFPADEGMYWWAGQIAAVMSVMSAAAWVQRYTFEDPQKQRTWSEDYGSTLMGIFAAILTALAVLIPINDNLMGREDANVPGVGWINGLWLFVFIFWLLMVLAILFFQRWRGGANNLPRYPREFRGNPPGNRDHMTGFLWSIVISVLISLGLIGWWTASADSPWPNIFGWLFGLLTALIFVIGQFMKVSNANKELRADPPKILLTEFWGRRLKDRLLLLTGCVLFLAQVGMIVGWTQAVLSNDFAKMVYIVVLITLCVAAILGIYVDTYRMRTKWWEARRPKLRRVNTPLPEDWLR